MSQIRSLLIRLNSLASSLTTGWRHKVITALFAFGSIVLITIVTVTNWDLFTSYAWVFRPIWLLYAISLFVIDLSISLWAWHLLVARLANYSNLRQSTKICLYANLARRIPGSVWYIASRAVQYKEVGISKTTTSLLSGLELVFFIVSGLVTTLLTLPFWIVPAELLSNSWQLWFLLIMLPFSALMVHPHFLQVIWQRVSKQTPSQKLRWRDTTAWLGLYILTWIVGGLVLFSVINLFQVTPVSDLVIVIGIWSLAGTISLTGFITISIFGLREISLTLLLTQLMPAPVTLIIAVTVRLIWLIGELITSILSLRL